MTVLQRYIFLPVLLLCVCLCSPAHTGEEITQVDLIFDASGSMKAQFDGKARIDIARDAMKVLLAEFAKNPSIQLGLRIYGHTNNLCTNSVLEIPIGESNNRAIQAKIDSIRTKGKTPIAYSLLQSINDFDQAKSGNKYIVLITDGMENCGGDICAAALKLKSAGILTSLHVVGIGMKPGELASLNCVAAPFGGKVIGAANSSELINAFKTISGAIAVDRNLEVIGKDKNGKEVYMDVLVYKDNQVVSKSEGVAPSFKLDPGIYTVVAKSRNTKAEISKENIKVEKSKKDTVEIIFAQSSVSLKSVGENNKDLYGFYTIYKSGTQDVVAEISGKGLMCKSVLPGTYDIKVYEQDTYGTMYEKGIKISEGEVYTHTFKFIMGKVQITPVTAFGGVSREYWWYNFYKKGSENKEKIAPEGVGKKEATLLPGSYVLKVLDGYNKVVQEVAVTVAADKTDGIKVSVPK